MDIANERALQRAGWENGMDHETALEELRERYARGGLPLEEFRRLMGTLMVTTDPTERAAILAQLPPEPPHMIAEMPATRIRTTRPATSGGKVHRVSAFFGEVDRSGSLWELGPETHVSATFGSAKVDVRMARLTEGENVLRVTALFGEVTVIVPEGLRVYVDSSARFGEVAVPGHHVGGITGQDSFTLGSADAGSWLRIEATATFGEVSIKAR